VSSIASEVHTPEPNPNKPTHSYEITQPPFHLVKQHQQQDESEAKRGK
jgi:hypothetical protein